MFCFYQYWHTFTYTGTVPAFAFSQRKYNRQKNNYEFCFVCTSILAKSMAKSRKRCIITSLDSATDTTFYKLISDMVNSPFIRSVCCLLP